YWANGQLEGIESRLDPAQIVATASATDAPENRIALQAVRDFTAIAGSVCGDLALSMGSLGGLYLSGDMLRKMGALLDHALFVERFSQKGPFSDWIKEVPVGYITVSNPALRGCANYIFRNDQSGSSPGSGVR